MSTNKGWEVHEKDDDPLEGKTVQDFLYFEGMYNPIVRFAFTNDSNQPFVSYWDSGKITIQPHDTVKLEHHLAQKFTRELVDRLMDEDGKGALRFIKANRKPYEDRILSFLPIETGTTMEVIKSKFVAQLAADASRQVGVRMTQPEMPKMDFNDLTKQNFEDSSPKAAKAKKKAA